MNYLLYKYNDSNNISFEFEQISLTNFIQVHRGDIISFAGAGGKTTTIMALAEELAERSLKVLITTTTKMYWTEQTILDGDIKGLKQALNNYGIAITGIKQGLKMTEPTEEFLQRATELADVVLIEADGARHRPFKIPRQGEPVYLPDSNKIVYLAGLSALQMKIEKAARSELLAAFLHKKPLEKLTADDIIKVLSSRQGALKDADGRDFYLILNQVDNNELRQAAQYIIRTIYRSNRNIKTAYSCHLR